jgi:phytoene dehydrogenase-like protein
MLEAARACPRGQSSLEALLAFAALLCALAALAHAAKAQTDAFSSAVDQADARASLAREAFYIDLSASIMPQASMQHGLAGVPVSDGSWLASNGSGALREPLFHKLSVDADGGYYVQTE